MKRNREFTRELWLVEPREMADPSEHRSEVLCSFAAAARRGDA
jgi:hypothetical protein